MAKKKKQKQRMEGCSSTRSRLEILPGCLLVNDILLKLDLEALCTLSCVSTTLLSSASQALALLPSLDLSDFSPDFETLQSILSRCQSFKTLTLNCLQDHDWSNGYLLRPHIEELNLLRCFSFNPRLLESIG